MRISCLSVVSDGSEDNNLMLILGTVGGFLYGVCLSSSAAEGSECIELWRDNKGGGSITSLATLDHGAFAAGTSTGTVMVFQMPIGK